MGRGRQAGWSGVEWNGTRWGGVKYDGTGWNRKGRSGIRNGAASEGAQQGRMGWVDEAFMGGVGSDRIGRDGMT